MWNPVGTIRQRRPPLETMETTADPTTAPVGPQPRHPGHPVHPPHLADLTDDAHEEICGNAHDRNVLLVDTDHSRTERGGLPAL